jgi:hypothetical protein
MALTSRNDGFQDVEMVVTCISSVLLENILYLGIQARVGVFVECISPHTCRYTHMYIYIYIYIHIYTH